MTRRTFLRTLHNPSHQGSPGSFVVDNNWVINESAPKEPDHEGNVNNFLNPDQITQAAPAAAVINSAAPSSSTAVMAGEQPVLANAADDTKVIDEKHVNETPAETTTESKPLNEKVLDEKAAEPQPTPTEIPGFFPVTPATELDKSIGINPLPASEGGVNPISLQPGEKIPESITAQSTDAHVKLDKESYEKSDALPGFEGINTELPPVSSNTIPESSLPIDSVQDATISTVTPTATTALLAGEVPLETKAPVVPEIVKESQEKANVSPEASAETEEVKEKAQVEEELKETVPVAAVTSEGTAKKEGDSDLDLAAIAATAGGAVIAAGGAVAAAALAAKETVQEQSAPYIEQATTQATAAARNLPDPVKEQLPVSLQEALVTETTPLDVSVEVPPEVKESIVESNTSPEAAGNTEAVEDKKAVETELLKEVKPVPAAAESETVQVVAKDVAPVDVAPVVPAVIESKPEDVSAAVPAEVKESLIEADKSPEAAANTEAVEDKKAVETELLKEVKPVPAEPEAKTEEVKTETPVAVTETAPVKTEAPVATTQTEQSKTETRVASTENGTTATETTAAENGSKAAENGSKAGETEANGSSTKTKKKNRLSTYISKLKHKFA
ncbi:Cruciform DNA binding protein [Neonectria punicea]|uniref:Cruciform DNA binding protein n=1 Tax=Neonectria punicea TaxID=979145 RepID=A0ABR1GJJ9_9HYPO